MFCVCYALLLVVWFAVWFIIVRCGALGYFLVVLIWFVGCLLCVGFGFVWCFVVTVFGICLLGAWHCLHFLYVGFSNAGGWLSVLLCCECGCVCLRCFDAVVGDGCVDGSVLLLLVSIASLLLCLC